MTDNSDTPLPTSDNVSYVRFGAPFHQSLISRVFVRFLDRQPSFVHHHCSADVKDLRRCSQVPEVFSGDWAPIGNCCGVVFEGGDEKLLDSGLAVGV